MKQLVLPGLWMIALASFFGALLVMGQLWYTSQAAGALLLGLTELGELRQAAHTSPSAVTPEMIQVASHRQQDLAGLATEADQAFTPPGLGALDEQYKAVLNQAADISERLAPALNQRDTTPLIQIDRQAQDLIDQMAKVRRDLQDANNGTHVLLAILLPVMLLSFGLGLQQRKQATSAS